MIVPVIHMGSRKDNPLLLEGDAVIVDRVDKVVSIHGLIKYPGIYEFINGETVDHLIEIAGGILAKARKDSIEVVSFENGGKR